ncbi:hypothetical protein APR08_003757 [Nocardia amikacinitolerans]|nr:hypothetical protein [Nocardia amikacinitolerans]
MTSQPTTLGRTRRLLTRLLQAIALDRPEYRGPRGEFADDDETARHTLPPDLWPDAPG